MLEQLNTLQIAAKNEFLKIKDTDSLEQTRVKYLGRKGLLSQLMKTIGSLPPEENPLIGKKANECKKIIECLWEERVSQLQQKSRQGKKEKHI